MNTETFSNWVKWQERDNLNDIKIPGIYCIAKRSNVCLSGKPFDWQKEIIYIGFTNSIKGLKGRIKQFDNSLKGKPGHGGADRVAYEWPEYTLLVKDLYVSVNRFQCDVKTNHPNDLRVMGDVTQYEYYCFAKYVEKYNQLPQFNDKKRSPGKLRRDRRKHLHESGK